MDPSVENNLTTLRSLCAKNEVQAMYVFGSAATGKRTPRSDFDFLVRFRDIPFDWYTENYFRLHYAIEALLGAPIDLLTEPSIKNPIFKAEVDKTKTEIYPSI